MSAPSTTDNRLAFAILGPLRVTDAGVPVALGGRQQRAILARLAVAGASGVSLEQLADMLWGERPPGGFATTSRPTSSICAKSLNPTEAAALPAAVLVTENGRYRLTILPHGSRRHHLPAHRQHRTAIAGQRRTSGSNCRDTESSHPVARRRTRRPDQLRVRRTARSTAERGTTGRARIAHRLPVSRGRTRRRDRRTRRTDRATPTTRTTPSTPHARLIPIRAAIRGADKLRSVTPPVARRTRASTPTSRSNTCTSRCSPTTQHSTGT